MNEEEFWKDDTHTHPVFISSEAIMVIFSISKMLFKKTSVSFHRN